MLQLQRASAGSGKTYMLARLFIWFFITTVGEDGVRRLRKRGEISDSLDHIMAVTFTNKATNEMRDRIVQKLDALASFSPQDKWPDYMKDFTEALGEKPENIAQVCGEALRILLNDYSTFHVSTIDSFFQSVLRTFATEVDINDTYGIELDSDLVGEMGVDATLDDINTRKEKSSAYRWAELLMNRYQQKDKKWNIFNKQVSSPNKNSSDNNSYTGLMSAVKRMTTEEYKENRGLLDEYFESGQDFALLYDTLKTKYETPPREAFKEMKKALEEYIRMWSDAGLDPESDGVRYLGGHLKKMSAWRWDTVIFKENGEHDSKKSFKPIAEGKRVVCEKKADKATEERLAQGYFSLIRLRDRWVELRNTEEFLHWSVYAVNLPYLAMLGEVRNHSAEYLEESNTIELAETNSILNAIINEDDTPFIYERLGTRLNHYLIDEFQDTSRLQWKNLAPLLHESDGRGCDNLIIGDAKQSIYRFRNADPSLITKAVPDSFPSCRLGGMDMEENANWRSRKNIVEFNNFLFSRLCRELQDPGQEEGRISFTDLYANVVQLPRGEKGGYIDFRIYGMTSAIYEEFVTKETLNQIVKLLDKGYRMKDIAVLTDTNKQGEKIIKEFVAYNAGVADSSRRIEFISDNSLSISNSQAVRMIVSAMRSLAKGHDPEINKEDNGKYRERIDWWMINCNFNFYSIRHPEMTLAEQFDNFLHDNDITDRLRDLVGEMQTVAMPALVEALAESFVPERLRKSEVAYIAALQDAVLDFCGRGSADLVSFLDWWDKKGKNINIASPEGVDAVRVMTIHKSKGLEFKCVIVPFLNYSVEDDDSKSEWRWVKPNPIINAEGFTMPPLIPVDTKKQLLHTSHRDRLLHFFDLKKMDALNNTYVAFTRAVDELYVMGCVGSSDSKNKKEPSGADGEFKKNSAGGVVANILIGRSKEAPDGELYQISPDMVRVTTRDDMQPPAPEEGELPPAEDGGESRPLVRIEVGAATKPEVSEGSAADSGYITEGDYYVNSGMGYLKYVDENPGGEEDEEYDEFTASDRPEGKPVMTPALGSVLHAVMERVEKASDLHRSVTRLVAKGIVYAENGYKIERFLADAISDPKVSGWFSGSYRVMTERSLLLAGDTVRRPDRVMVSKEGRCIVVDYKFGVSGSHARYVRQVDEYMRRLRDSGNFLRVEGYIWYVVEDSLRKV